MSELLANLLFTRQLIYFERISIERRSEISVLVNTLEKAAQLKFSIRVFGSVYVSGSQSRGVFTFTVREFAAHRLASMRMCE